MGFKTGIFVSFVIHLAIVLLIGIRLRSDEIIYRPDLNFFGSILSVREVSPGPRQKSVIIRKGQKQNIELVQPKSEWIYKRFINKKSVKDLKEPMVNPRYNDIVKTMFIKDPTDNEPIKGVDLEVTIEPHKPLKLYDE